MGIAASRFTNDPKYFLENATPNTILEALTSGFVKGFNGYSPIKAFATPTSRDRIEDVFNQYGTVSDIDNQTHWNEQALRNCFNDFFPKSDALDSCITILWRYFHFHAFFPFPRTVNQPIGYSAFQRALAWIALDGSSWLGIDANQALPMPEENDVCDRILYEPTDLWRTFRSFSARSEEAALEKEVVSELVASSDAEEDLLDVLAFTQPANPCRMTVQRKELRPHARRILASSKHCNEYSLTLADLGHLVWLLLSLQVHKTVRDGIDQKALVLSVNEDRDASKSLTNSVLDRFKVHGRKTVEWQTFKDVIRSHLPNLLHQLRLVFTTIISTSPTPIQKSAYTVPQATILTMYHAQYLSFFLPSALPFNSAWYRPASEHSATHFALQKPEIIYSASIDQISAQDITQALTPCKSQTLLLLTGFAVSAPKTNESPATSTTQVTFGAYMPTPWISPRPREYTADQGHVIFQLEPRQELLEPTDPDRCISEFVQINTSSTKKGRLTFGTGNENESGLKIDFSSGIAHLTNLATKKGKDEHQNEGANTQALSATYQDVSVWFEKEKPTYLSKLSLDRKAEMQIHNLEIYRLPGSIHRIRDYNLPSITARLKPPSSPTPYPPPASQKDQVNASDLAKRIQGFGSTR